MIDIKPSFNIQIWLGLKNTKTGIEQSISEVERLIQKQCDEIGECVTITPTRFIYTKGNESGVVIGYINYPRFPKDTTDILTRAINLGNKLMIEFDQCRVTITFPDRTYILTNEKLVKEIEK